jgi:hypothetical protein
VNKEYLLRCIADVGYNVGFGAKKHFATYDIILKVPSTAGYLLTAIDVYALVLDSLSANWLSASLIVIVLRGYKFTSNPMAAADRPLPDVEGYVPALVLRANW